MSHVFTNNRNSFNTINYTLDHESEILAWLSRLNPRERHQEIGTQRLDDIGAWLLKTEEFRHWHSGSRENKSYHPTVFCNGNLGVGKSYIFSLVIDKLCETVDKNTVVTCFYFDFAARNEQSAVNVLGSLLRQLVSGLGGIPDVVVEYFRTEKRFVGGRSLLVPRILELFQIIAASKRTFICVDALDECVPEQRAVVLRSLRKILEGSPNTRIFMTGRPHVQSEVRRLHGEVTFISIQPTKDGVVGYLRDKLDNDTAPPEAMSSALKAAILKSIPEISSETILLPSLHIKAILKGTTVSKRRRALESIKNGAGLGDAYGVELERIRALGEERTKLAMATLTWVCHSERPLQVDELCNALAVEVGATDFDVENVPPIESLLEYCQGLITVDKETLTVRLIHYHLQEYLRSHPALFSKPHSILAETCLTYLNSHQVKNLTSYSLTSHTHPDHQGMPFLKYSSRYWGTHAERGPSEYPRALAVELLEQYEDHVSAVSLLEQVMHPSDIGGIGTAPLFSGLHCASFFGIVDLVSVLINAEGCEINQQDCSGSTPLSWAAVNGHEGVVEVLLERRDVDPNNLDMKGRTPLAGAALNGHEGVVKLLLKREDIDPNHPDENDRTPLGDAATNGHEGVVKLLLKREEVDPNHLDVNDRTPLGDATTIKHEGVVKMLLGRKDVDPERSDKRLHSTLSEYLDGAWGIAKLPHS